MTYQHNPRQHQYDHGSAILCTDLVNAVRLWLGIEDHLSHWFPTVSWLETQIDYEAVISEKWWDTVPWTADIPAFPKPSWAVAAKLAPWLATVQGGGKIIISDGIHAAARHLLEAPVNAALSEAAQKDMVEAAKKFLLSQYEARARANVPDTVPAGTLPTEAKIDAGLGVRVRDALLEAMTPAHLLPEFKDVITVRFLPGALVQALEDQCTRRIAAAYGVGSVQDEIFLRLRGDSTAAQDARRGIACGRSARP